MGGAYRSATSTLWSPVIRDDLTSSIDAALNSIAVEARPAKLELERPASREHGDWSSNVAMVLAKVVGRPPRELAADLAAVLNSDPPPHVASVEVAGPGFLNFRLSESWLHDVLIEVVRDGPDSYARHDFGMGTKVNVEFVSANPTGPLHAGGGRWAAYGDSLASILERCGYEVHREYYLNDRGTQMTLFGLSLAARRAGDEPPEDGYQGQYIIDWAREMPADADPGEWGYERVKRDLRESLAGQGVIFDTWFSERSLVDSGAIEATLAELTAKGATYEADGATWLRSTDYDDDKDRVLVRSDGEYTYVLPDLAYHRDKFERGFDLLIDVWGSDHHGYVKRLRAGVAALGHDPEQVEILIGQLVTLVRDGEEAKISKRAGDMVLIDDLVALVGADAARMTFLAQSLDSRQTIDLDLITAKTMDNPVFYVQYAHARIQSIHRKLNEVGLERVPLAEADLSLLVHDRELEVLRSLAELPDVVGLACRERAPHRVAAWLRELAAAFHGFYHDCYVIADSVEPELTQARLWLVESTRVGLVIGLDLLGVSAPETM
jgi:arginyl-tRNA synthetase